MNPTPPPPFQIIPIEYLLAGNPQPSDAIMCWYTEWHESAYKGLPTGQHGMADLEKGEVWFASAQLDHPCFQPQPEKEVKTCAETHEMDAKTSSQQQSGESMTSSAEIGTPSMSLSASNTVADVPAGGDGRSTAEGMSAVAKVLFPAFVAKHGTLTPRDSETGVAPASGEMEQASTRVHELKTWPHYFEAVLSGIKTFEIRKRDRDYLTGDILHLREWDNETGQYTGRELQKKITYLTDWEQKPGYVVMAIVDAGQSIPPAQAPCAAKETADLIARVRELSVSADPGPWILPLEPETDCDVDYTGKSYGWETGREVWDGTISTQLVEGCSCTLAEMIQGNRKENAELMIEYRTITPQLADLCEQQQARIAELEKERDLLTMERARIRNGVRIREGEIEYLNKDLSAERQKRETAEKELKDLAEQQQARIAELERENKAAISSLKSLQDETKVMEDHYETGIIKLRTNLKKIHDDALSAERQKREVTEGLVTRMVRRTHSEDESSNCPFCERYPSTGAPQQCPQCKLCQLEASFSTHRAKIQQQALDILTLTGEIAELRKDLNWQNHRNSEYPTKGGFEFYINEEWTGLASAPIDYDYGWHCALRKHRIDPDDERVRIRRVIEDDAIIADLSTLRAEVEELRKDKERLTWLGEGGVGSWNLTWKHWNGSFRAAIDSAKGEQP